MTQESSTDTTPSESSPSQSSRSSSSSLVGSPTGTVGATIISLVSIGIITTAWFKGMLATAPWWVPVGGIVIAAIPGGAMAGVLGQVGRAAVDKIPGRSK